MYTVDSVSSPQKFYSRLCGWSLLLFSCAVRVFVEFERPHSHSHSSLADAPVLDAVYVALKRRQERQRLAIYVAENPRSEGDNPYGKQETLTSYSTQEEAPVAAVTGALKEMTLPDFGVKHIIITEVRSAKQPSNERLLHFLKISFSMPCQ